MYYCLEYFFSWFVLTELCLSMVEGKPYRKRACARVCVCMCVCVCVCVFFANFYIYLRRPFQCAPSLFLSQEIVFAKHFILIGQFSQNSGYNKTTNKFFKSLLAFKYRPDTTGFTKQEWLRPDVQTVLVLFPCLWESSYSLSYCDLYITTQG